MYLLKSIGNENDILFYFTISKNYSFFFLRNKYIHIYTDIRERRWDKIIHSHAKAKTACDS